MTNINQLRSRLGGLQMSLSKFAEKMGFSRTTARKKVDGEVQFEAMEIKRACEILQIPIEEVPLYFFNGDVAKTETCKE